MKANKAVKRLGKIEALLADVAKGYAAAAPLLKAALENVKAAAVKAKEAVTAKPAKAAKKKGKSKVKKKAAVKRAEPKAAKVKPGKKKARKKGGKKMGPSSTQVAQEAVPAPLGSVVL